MRGSPLMPDVAEQCAVAGQVSGGADSPVLDGGVSLGLGVPEHPVSRSLADGEDECVRYGSDKFPVSITVMVLVGLPGSGFCGHGVPS
jgi:hypothetical protein